MLLNLACASRRFRTMRKLLNNPAFVAVLAVVALAFVGWSILAKSGPAGSYAPEPTVADNVSPGEAETGVDTVGLSPAEALRALVIPTGMRDPFSLPAAKEDPATAPSDEAAASIVERVRLTAVWVQGAAVYLLLNGKVCEPGDRVGRFAVESAEIGGAWITFPGGRSFLSVGQDLAVKTSAQGLTTPLSQ